MKSDKETYLKSIEEKLKDVKKSDLKERIAKDLKEKQDKKTIEK